MGRHKHAWGNSGKWQWAGVVSGWLLRSARLAAGSMCLRIGQRWLALYYPTILASELDAWATQCVHTHTGVGHDDSCVDLSVDPPSQSEFLGRDSHRWERHPFAFVAALICMAIGGGHIGLGGSHLVDPDCRVPWLRIPSL